MDPTAEPALPAIDATQPVARVNPPGRFTAFLVVGLVSTCCNLASRYLFQLGLSYELALVGANAVGVLSAFLMNRWLVFRTTGAAFFSQLVRFVAVNLAGIAASWLVAVLLYRYAMPAVGFGWHPDLVAHAIGIAVPVLPNYLAHRAWTFNNK